MFDLSVNINYFITVSCTFAKSSVNSLYYFFKRYKFYFYTFFNPVEAKEYKLFRKLQKLESSPSQEDAAFLETVSKVNGLFEDKVVIQHQRRLNAPSVDLDLAIRHFQSLTGQEREQVRLHELAEMLSLKWDCGKSFDEPAIDSFWPAHKRAIQLENRYFMAKAREMRIPLTQKALHYMRVVDELNPTLSHVYLDKEDVQDAIEQLTKNSKNIPSVNEIEAYVKFIAESGCWQSMPPNKGCTRVWSRYFFTTLYQEFGPKDPVNYQKILLLLIFHYQTTGGFSKQLLEVLKQALSELDSDTRRIIALEFLDNMEDIHRTEKCSYRFNALIERIDSLLATLEPKDSHVKTSAS